MKSGDKVRFLRSKGDGIVRKVIDQKTVEVEIEDEFIIPVLKSDLVVISSDENILTRSSGERTSAIEEKAVLVTTGLYFAFIPFNDKILSWNIVNDSEVEVLVAVFEEIEKGQKGIYRGIVEPKQHVKIGDLMLPDFEKWPVHFTQAIFFRNGSTEVKEPINKRIKFKAESFFKSKRLAPVLNKEAFVYRIDTETLKFSPKEITEKMSENTLKKETGIVIERPSKEVDLHIEKLVTDFATMQSGEMLTIQIGTFETALEKAIATGMEEITFIHGAGNGILKNSIHKLLSANKNIKFFKDAQKEKFGYGATLVRIR